MDEALGAQIDDLAKRVTLIEEALNYLLEEKENSQLRQPSPSPVSLEPRNVQASMPTPAWTPPTETAAFKFPTKSVNWLGVVAVICFVLAGAFIIKLSIDSGWLTPARQIGIATLFGFALIGAGLRLVKIDKAYASLLPGAGIIVLYLTALAAHGFYGFTTAAETLGLVSVVSGICIWLYTIIRHDIYPVTAAAGSYLAPFLLGDSSQADFVLHYQMICTVAFGFIAVWVDSRLLSIIASYLAIAAVLVLSTMLHNDPLFAIVMAFHFCVFALAAVIHTIKTNRPLSTNEAWAYFPVLLLFYIGEYSLMEKMNHALAPWISLAFATFLIGIYFLAKKSLGKVSLDSANVIAAFASIVLFHALYIEILNDDLRPWLLPIIFLSAAFYPSKIKSTNAIPVLALTAVVATEYVQIFFELIGNHGPRTERIALAALLSTLTAFIFFVRKRRELPNAAAGAAILAGAHGLFVLGLYNLLEPSGSFAVSASWLAYALVIISVGFKMHDKTIAKSALIILGLAAGKALLYDAASAATIVRIGCLLVTGVVLFGCGLLLKRIDRWAD